MKKEAKKEWSPIKGQDFEVEQPQPPAGDVQDALEREIAKATGQKICKGCGG